MDIITTTREHRFYLRGKGFMPAGRLAIGNAIVTRAGPDAVVKKVEWRRRAGGYKVHNLVIEDNHTHFVGNAAGGVWVHNLRECWFRGAQPGEEPNNMLRPADYRTGTKRMVDPGQGLSINSVPGNLYHLYPDPYPVLYVPEGLSIVPNGPGTHGVISPAAVMSPEDYQALANQIIIWLKSASLAREGRWEPWRPNGPASFRCGGLCRPTLTYRAPGSKIDWEIRPNDAARRA